MNPPIDMTIIIDQYIKALTDKNPEKLEGLFYCEDSVAVFPNADVAVGAREIVKAHQAWFADSDWSATATIESETDFKNCKSVFLKIDYRDSDANGKPYEMEFYLSLIAVIKNSRLGIGQVQATLIH